MTEQPPKPPAYASPMKLPDEYMRLVGIIAAHWEFVEQITLTRAIAGMMELDYNQVALLLANVGFQSKVDLLVVHTAPLKDTDKPAWERITSALGGIREAYGMRNTYVHAVWNFEIDPATPHIRVIRTKNGKLRMGD